MEESYSKLGAGSVTVKLSSSVASYTEPSVMPFSVTGICPQNSRANM